MAWKINGGDRILIELIPVAVVKMFSSSAATGLLLISTKTHGADSMLGRAASVMLSSTETIFYTMSVYFMSVKVKKTRYTSGSPFCNHCRNCGKCISCGKPEVVRIVLLFAYNLCVAAKVSKISEL